MTQEIKRKPHEHINLLITIMRRGIADRVINDLREMGVTYNMAAVGESRESKGMIHYAGLGDGELDIIFSVVSESKVEPAIALIEYGYSDDPDGGAVGILVPIEGVSGPLALEFISGPEAR